MRLPPVKCNMMQKNNNKQTNKETYATYTLEGTVLENVESIKYLVVQAALSKFGLPCAFLGKSDLYSFS